MARLKQWLVNLNLLPLMLGAVVLLAVLRVYRDIVYKADVNWFRFYVVSLIVIGPAVLLYRFKAKKHCRHCQSPLAWKNRDFFEAEERDASKKFGQGARGHAIWAIGNLFENLNYECEHCRQRFRYHTVIGWLKESEQ